MLLHWCERYLFVIDISGIVDHHCLSFLFTMSMTLYRGHSGRLYHYPCVWKYKNLEIKTWKKCFQSWPFWISCLEAFGCIAPKTLNHLAFQSSDFERTWWRLFQKRVLYTKCDIFVFIIKVSMEEWNRVTAWMMTYYM